MPNQLRLLFPAIALLLVFGQAARSDEAEDVKEKLERAKRVYDGQLKDFKKAVTDLFDKKEDTVRKAGDKKALDDLKAQRKAFDELGESPATLPMSVKSELTTARTTLDKAYQSAIKEYIKLKLDDAAEKTEKEYEQFILASAFMSGKQTYVSTLKPFDVKVSDNRFDKDTNKYKMDGRAIPHSLFMHAEYFGVANVSYTLPIKATAFRVFIGVPKHSDDQGNPATPLVFEVLLDGKSVWKSEPVSKLDTFQTCVVKVEKTMKIDKAKTLTLRVHCPREHGGAHCVWFAPVVIE
ncbi:NPCBM/NEW2 domain-containing protein [Zavarzinella formosa]|uniref:NPCBM/NEW2 domain-containing protein n=1 Tax=Zavarzinella formosa TaxID=360055 RepID=UPI0002ECA265|nr:NPCBM/NEW2 domain-containing protein [Zavarzinella formosa]